MACSYSEGILVLTDLSSDLIRVLQGQIFVCMNYSETLVHYMQSLFFFYSKQNFCFQSVLGWCEYGSIDYKIQRSGS